MALQTKTYTRGSTVWGSELNAYQVDLTITEESVNEQDNTSLISYRFQISSGNNAFSLCTTTRRLILNGITIGDVTSQLSLSKQSTLVYFEGSINVGHNSDGTLDMSIVAFVDMPKSHEGSHALPYAVTFNETMTLTPISVFTACSAPASVSISPSVFEDKVDVIWSGASGGQNNHITGYNINCSYSSDNHNWSEWVTILWTNGTSASFSLDWLTQHTIDVSRGNYLKFWIRTCGSEGEAYHSEWKEIGVVRKRSVGTYINGHPHIAYIQHNGKIDVYVPCIYKNGVWQNQ